MLMSHKNFHFTQIPDKTNDIIFFKKLKNPVFGHFFLMGIFSKKSDCHTQLYVGPQHQAKFQKKLLSKFQEKLRTGPIS